MWPGCLELVDLRLRRQRPMGAQRTAVQRRHSIRVAERLLEIAIRRSKETGGQTGAERVARAGAVNAIDRKCPRPNLASVAPGQAALIAERDGHEAGPEVAPYCLERAPAAFMSGQRRRERLGCEIGTGHG